MARHKVAEMSGALLDAAVAMAEGIAIRYSPARGYTVIADDPDATRWQPTQDLRQAGEIIERARIATAYLGDQWKAFIDSDRSDYVENGYIDVNSFTDADGCGETLCVAAMRAWVTAKLGPEVDLP